MSPGGGDEARAVSAAPSDLSLLNSSPHWQEDTRRLLGFESSELYFLFSNTALSVAPYCLSSGEDLKDNLSEGPQLRIARRRNKAERTPRTMSSSAVHTRYSTAVPPTHSPLAPGCVNTTARVSTHSFACMAALPLLRSMVSALLVCVKTRPAVRALGRPCGLHGNGQQPSCMCNKHQYAHST